MSVLVVGLSHRSATVELLERSVVADDDIAKLLALATSTEHVDEAVVLATCNRLEVYADVRKFHGGVQELTDALVQRTGVPLEELADHLYVHYEDRAVQHLFEVASGLDSMVVGEQQILGQLRSALQTAREEATVGRALGPLIEHALRAGKRAHAETGIDRAGRSLVSVALDLAHRSLGGLGDRAAALVGAGSMSSLAATTLRRRGVAALVVVNRTPANAQRLAQSVDATVAPMEALVDVVADADLLVSCTGAVGTMISADVVAEAMSRRPERPLFVIDLALPRDVEPAAKSLPGVTVVDLESLRSVLEDAEVARDVDAARQIVTEEVGSHLARQRAERVAPTVVALRTRAQQVVDAELTRIEARLPGLDERTRGEIRTAITRVVDKLLHTPTVRVKELAESPGGDSYADALRELFALDPAAMAAVARADVVVEDEQP
ncbi:MAG TPA: glutamyl-tRNA reductase [Mycobacteriales bacterium]|jgi:glutamyl-tRNA reductase|nr:glutamyl-tRNA reductase [Mycobacteriales bacterium]